MTKEKVHTENKSIKKLFSSKNSSLRLHTCKPISSSLDNRKPYRLLLHQFRQYYECLNLKNTTIIIFH